jgi:DNA-binding PadR family transcriptional regulator
MDDLTAFQRDTLRCIADLHAQTDTPKGLEILDAIQEEYEDKVFHGRLYPNLDDLVEMGLVSKGSLNKRSNYYALTDEGWGRLLTIAERYQTVANQRETSA